VEAGRRMERAMRKEGIEKHSEKHLERVEEKDGAEPVRPARVRRQVDPGAFVRE
jgi:hypothetical protein